MDSWTPISEAEIREKLASAWKRMEPPQKRLWEAISADPVKWQQEPFGSQGGGFWIVAIYGSNVIWYNDIEDGFNRSHWSTFGKIDDYWCNQDELEWTVQHLLDELEGKKLVGGYFGPPEQLQ